MSEMEMTTEAEVEEFTNELSDEALDRAEGARHALLSWSGDVMGWVPGG